MSMSSLRRESIAIGQRELQNVSDTTIGLRVFDFLQFLLDPLPNLFRA